MDKIDKGIIEAFTQVKKSNKIDNPVLFNQDITELWPQADSLKATELILVAFLMQHKWNMKELRRITSNLYMQLYLDFEY